MSRGRRWVEAAGGIVEDEGDEAGVEVSPLISYVRIIHSSSLREVLTFFNRAEKDWNSSRARLTKLLS
jgi:hypothetical protein